MENNKKYEEMETIETAAEEAGAEEIKPEEIKAEEISQPEKKAKKFSAKKKSVWPLLQQPYWGLSRCLPCH